MPTLEGCEDWLAEDCLFVFEAEDFGFFLGGIFQWLTTHTLKLQKTLFVKDKANSSQLD